MQTTFRKMDKKFLSFGEDVGKQFAKMQNDTPMESNYECTLLTKQSHFQEDIVNIHPQQYESIYSQVF